MAAGVQHRQTTWIIAGQNPDTVQAAMAAEKCVSTNQNPNRMSGPKILGLPFQPFVQIRLQLLQTARELLAESHLIDFLQDSLVKTLADTVGLR
jgi:hypothetical protein